MAAKTISEHGPISSVDGRLTVLHHTVGETSGPAVTVKLETPPEDISLLTAPYGLFFSLGQKPGLAIVPGYGTMVRFWFIPNKDLENLN